MLSYTVKRLAVAVPTLLILIVISFLLMHAAPGGPFTEEKQVPAAILANLNAKYGLDQPLWRQMIAYVWGIVAHFDLGPSFIYKDRTVNEISAQGFPVTLYYGMIAFGVAVPGGVLLGVVAAIFQNSWVDYIAVGVSIGAQVLPNFVMAPFLIPVLRYLGPTFVSMITGSVVVDMYFSTGGIGKAFVDSALNRDYSVMMGVTLLVGALTILFNLLVDVLYAWIDPKIRY